MKIEVEVPEDIEEYAPHIKGLLHLCVTKLFVNAHKSTPHLVQVDEMIARMKEEIGELERQIEENALKGNALLEVADVVNFALLTYIALRRAQMEHKGNVTEANILATPGTNGASTGGASKGHQLPSGEGTFERETLVDHPHFAAAKHSGALPKRRYNGTEGGPPNSLERHKS